MKEATIKIYDDRPSEFWSLMGPHFASRKTRRELPYLHDEPEYVWVLATDEDGSLAGFASMHVDAKGLGQLHGLFIRPDYRGEGLARKLLEVRMKYLEATGVKVVCVTANGKSRPLLETVGFEETGKRGSYTTMRKVLNELGA